MAVPKKKTSKSRRGMRRAHKNAKPINVITNKDGFASLPGHIASDGTYGGKLIIAPKVKSTNSSN
jgi:large subunit ribosomal protein L32